MKGTEFSGGIQTGHRCQVEIAFGNLVYYSYKHGNENEMAFAQKEDSGKASLSFPFYILRNKRIHTVFMGGPSAVAVKDFFTAGMEQPVMIVSE